MKVRVFDDAAAAARAVARGITRQLTLQPASVLGHELADVVHDVDVRIFVAGPLLEPGAERVDELPEVISAQPSLQTGHDPLRHPHPEGILAHSLKEHIILRVTLEQHVVRERPL